MFKIPLIKPYITDEVKTEVCKVLDSGYLTEGPVTYELEKAFKTYIGCKNAIAVTSCTTGLEIALRALKIGPGDEVIVPDYTYPATAAVVNIVGATAVIVDINRDTMLIDYDAIENAITDRTKAAIPVSIFGNPLNYDRLNKIKKEHDLYIIEDAACSIGALFQGNKIGNLADVSVFSLHPRKFITTGEGGMITTDDQKLADWINSYKHFGIGKIALREKTSFDMIGTNSKLSDLLSAVGLIQMRHIDELVDNRLKLAQNYTILLKDCQKIKLPITTQESVHSYQSFCIFIENRDDIMASMRKAGIEVQIGTYSLHMHKAFNDNPNCRIVGQMEGSIYAFDHCMVLPMYFDMTESDQEYVVEHLLSFIK